MNNKTITISHTTFKALKTLMDEGDTVDDAIWNLIVHYNENEEFTDAQAEFYNSEIDKSENGFYDNDEDIMTYEELNARISEYKRSIGEQERVEDISKRMNVPLGNKLKEIEETEDLFDIEVLPQKDPLTVEELKKIIREDDDGRESRVRFTDVLGIVESPTEINSSDEEWRCYRS